MTRWIILTAFLGTAGTVVSAAPTGKFTFLDLKPYANQKLTDNLGSGRDGNHLKELGKGGRTFQGVNLQIGEGFIQLGSPRLAMQKPAKVEGIKVGGKVCARIHILHATGYGHGEEGDGVYIADGTRIAGYKIHYEDGKSETIPVVYGEDVRDWWLAPNAKGVTRGKVAWVGDNELAKSFDRRIRVYLTSWENQHPGKKIATIDYLKVGDGPAAPFCLAITLEARDPEAKK